MSKMLFLGAIMTMSNACIGATLLQLPYRFSKLGVIVGSAYFCFAAIYSFWSFRLVTKVCGEAKTYSVRSMLMRTCGKWTTLMIDISTVGMYFGGACSYCIIGADYIHSSYNWVAKVSPCVEPLVFDDLLCSTYEQCLHSSKNTSTYCILIVGLGIFLLESLISQIQILSYMSSCAIVCVIFTVVCLSIRVGQALTNNSLPFSPTWVKTVPSIPIKPELSHILIDLPSFFGLFSLQAFIPPYFAELKMSENGKQQFIKRASDTTVFVVAFIYYVTAFLGPLIFNGQNQPLLFQSDNILNNFGANDTLMAVVRILYTVVVLICFPLVLFTLRSSLCAWIGIDRTQGGKQKLYYYLCGISVCVLVTVLAVLVPSISVIMDLFGAVFGCILFQLMPLLLNMNKHKANAESDEEVLVPEGEIGQYSKLPEQEQSEIKKSNLIKESSRTEKIINWVVFYSLIAVNIISFVYSIVNMFTKKKASSVCDQ
ncbi:Amino_acid transporter family protein [Hexamita inflata]|uniref:Amino acid transporter family protein n=1 Tax=Hexamita inflata TaxID=28002 RepID=A0AA86NJX9_9EUKA|nr:Amino acid transporter family protein [Hexamita inflata]